MQEKTHTAKKKTPAAKPGKQVLQTRIIDDVFTDAVDAVKPRFQVNIDAYLDRLWEASPEIYNILKNSKDLEEARESIYNYLQKAERRIFDVDNDLHILEKS
ncbi:MAG: hypothetical protein ABR597_08690, partial [Bacteroidales bacterium]